MRAEQPTTDGVIALLSGIDMRGRRVGVQLYPGATDNRLVEFVVDAGAVPDPVTPYEYTARAADEPITTLIDQLATGAIDVIALTSAPQIRRLFDVAQAHGRTDRLLAALRQTTIAAIGPVVAEALQRRDLTASIMPGESYFHEAAGISDRSSIEHVDGIAQLTPASRLTRLNARISSLPSGWTLVSPFLCEPVAAAAPSPSL